MAICSFHLLLTCIPLVVCHNSCKEVFATSNGRAPSGGYTITIRGEPVKVYCDMSSHGGGWTMFANALDTSKNCETGGNGEFMSKDQTSGWRLSDVQIQSLQGNSGKIWYSEPGYCNGSAFSSREYTKNGNRCTGELFFEYGNDGSCNSCKFQSNGGNSNSIKKCSNTYDGSYTAGPGYSNHYGLDTYASGDVYNDGICGMYFMWCYQRGLFRDHHNRMNIPGAWFYLREGDAPVIITTTTTTTMMTTTAITSSESNACYVLHSLDLALQAAKARDGVERAEHLNAETAKQLAEVLESVLPLGNCFSRRRLDHVPDSPDTSKNSTSVGNGDMMLTNSSRFV